MPPKCRPINYILANEVDKAIEVLIKHPELVKEIPEDKSQPVLDNLVRKEEERDKNKVQEKKEEGG